MSKDDAAIPSARQSHRVLYGYNSPAVSPSTARRMPFPSTTTAGIATAALTSFPPDGAGTISQVSFDGDHHNLPHYHHRHLTTTVTDSSAAATKPQPAPLPPHTPTLSRSTNTTATSTNIMPKQQELDEDEDFHCAALAPMTMSAPCATATRLQQHPPPQPPPQHRDDDADDINNYYDDEGTTTPKDETHSKQHTRQHQQLQDYCHTSPIDTVHAAPFFMHSESVASDLSSSSADVVAAAAAEATLSPSQYNIPPAPPSTPASSHASFSMSFDFGNMHHDDMDDAGALIGAGPPTLGSVAASTCYLNTTRTLEEQHERFLAEAATPLPPRQACDDPATPGPDDLSLAPKLPTDDFSDWAVGDRYELLRILGRGSYGEVAQAIDTYQQRSGRHRHAKGESSPEADKDDENDDHNIDGDDMYTYVAIKRIQSPFDQQVDAVRLYREIHILRQMQSGMPHQCLIQLLDVVQPPTDDLDDFHDLYLVFEYADTDLHKLILSPQYLTTAHIQTFLYQMLAGLKYMHSCSVIHRDLKPANILLNEDCSLKICDFGLARIVDRDAISATGGAKRKVMDPTAVTPNKRKRTRTSRFPEPPVPKCLTRQLTKHVVTRWYRAPELILIQPYTSAVDIWSLGCIFAELLGMQAGNVPGYADRKPLFPGGTCYPLSGEGGNIKSDDRLDQLSVIFSVIGTPSKDDIKATGKANDYIESLPHMKPKSLAEVYPEADKNAINLLEQMLRFNPNERVTAEDALEHDFFKGVRKKEELERSAVQPLTAPAFLEAEEIDLRSLKEKIYNEVLWYRDSSAVGTTCTTITTTTTRRRRTRIGANGHMAKTSSDDGERSEVNDEDGNDDYVHDVGG